MGFHDFAGCVGRGDDEDRDGAQVEEHDGAVFLGERVETAVGE